MNCKHCQAPLEDGNSVCPSCGWDNSLPEETETIAFSPEETAQAPATPEESSGSPEQDLPSPGEASDSQPKPVNRKKLALVIGGAVLVLALIAVAIWFLARPAESLPTEPAESTASTTDTTPEETAEPTGVLVREDYTFEGDDITPELSKAVATMGDATLSNGLLQIFYWRSYYDFLNNYSSYIAYIGLDTTKPLNEQTCGMSSTTMTWEQFFLDNALQTWAQYQAVRLDAEAAGYTISEGTQTQLNSSAQQLETSAQQYGFDSVQAMLEADFGAGVTAETYQSYMELYMTSMDYYYSQMDALTLCLPLLPPPPLPIKADWMPAAFWTACIRRRWGSQCPPFCAANVGSLILPTAPFTAPSPTPVPWFFVPWLRRRWDWMRSNWAGPSGQLW